MKTNRKKKTILDFMSIAEERRSEKRHEKPPSQRPTILSPTKPRTGKPGRSIWSLRGRVVVIAEKPKAGRKIAYALSKRPFKKTLYGIPYYLISSDSLEIIVASAAGHLYGLYTSTRGYPVFTYEWRPLYEIDKTARHTEKFVKALARLCRNGDIYVNACDYDVEGSVIGYMIIVNHGDPRKSLRAKFSSLTADELRNAFKNLAELDWEMIEAGLARHELDWIWGINISRALMDAVKKASGKRIILSAGRVQTPTLRYVVENDIARNLFIPIPQYTLTVYILKNNMKLKLQYYGEVIKTRREAEEIAVAIKQHGFLTVARYDEKHIALRPPPAFNLGDLQEEAARIYGFSPYKTQTIAEKLYLDALISYPRTNSQKLPATLNYRGIMEKLAAVKGYGNLVSQLLRETRNILRPVQGPKKDPAHPAIYPTGVKPGDLKPDEWKIYDLIVRRFIAAFAPTAKLLRTTVIFKSEALREAYFQLTGQKITRYGWLTYYPFSRPEEKDIPSFRSGERVAVSIVSVRRTYTKPPERLSRIKILRWMENAEIGTEATRARIIEILFKRGYLISSGGRTQASDLGLGIIEVLMEYFPEITSVELTRYFEQEMMNIRMGSRRRSDVVAEAKKTLLRLIEEFDAKKTEIGEKLSYRLGYMKPPEKCMLCSREAYQGGLCRYHYEALKTIKEKYNEWRAREGVSWEEYISAVGRLKSTGKWVIDVIKKISSLGLTY